MSSSPFIVLPDESIDSSKKKITDLFDKAIGKQKECELQMRNITKLIQALKKLRDGNAENIFGEKLTNTEIDKCIKNIETDLKILPASKTKTINKN